MLFGVNDESKVYKVFDPVHTKIIICREVIF